MLLIEMCTEAEYEFLKFWYSCEWMIIKGQPESIYMVRGDNVLFEQDWKNGILWCRYSYVWSFFETEFRYNNMQIKEMIASLLETHLKNGGLTPIRGIMYNAILLETHLKNGGLTPLGALMTDPKLLETHLKSGGLTPNLALIEYHALLETHLKSGGLTSSVANPIQFFKLEAHLKSEGLTPKCNNRTSQLPLERLLKNRHSPL